MKNRRKFTAEFKARVSIEAIKERESVKSLAMRYNVHPNQINQWKKEFLIHSAVVFSQNNEKTTKSLDNELQSLYETIGRQKIEIDFLKKALS